jgi:hypothetical protein
MNTYQQNRMNQPNYMGNGPTNPNMPYDPTFGAGNSFMPTGPAPDFSGIGNPGGGGMIYSGYGPNGESLA